MENILFWNLYLRPCLLLLALALQVYFILKKQNMFIFSVLGAMCVSVVAYMDMDITLFIGQCMLLALQWVLKVKKEGHIQ